MESKKQAILVTGGTGNIGAWTTRQLVNKGFLPVVYDLKPELRYLKDISEEIRIVQGCAESLATGSPAPDQGVHSCVTGAGPTVLDYPAGSCECPLRTVDGKTPGLMVGHDDHQGVRPSGNLFMFTGVRSLGSDVLTSVFPFSVHTSEQGGHSPSVPVVYLQKQPSSLHEK